MDRETAYAYIKDISYEIGTTKAKILSDKDGLKIRECLDFLFNEIENMQNVIDYKLGMWTKDGKYGISLAELLEILDKAEKYDRIIESIKNDGIGDVNILKRYGVELQEKCWGI